MLKIRTQLQEYEEKLRNASTPPYHQTTHMDMDDAQLTYDHGQDEAIENQNPAQQVEKV